MPTPQQRRLIRTLRRLHAAREPLNIVAVKRRHPDLLKAVMAVTPYWGWKRALEAAGIAYARIKVELLDGIECALCGKWWRNLSSHLPLHDVRPDEYLMDYPESDLHCEKTRAREMKKDSAAIPHWEPLWSREYALDRLAEYHRRGLPINEKALYVKDNRLLRALNVYCGGWWESLKTIGLDPGEVRKQVFQQLQHYPDKPAVLQAIRQRHRNGRPVNHGGVARGTFKDNALQLAVYRHFNSWDDALLTAGIDPAEIRAQVRRKLRQYPDKPSLIEAIQKRQRDNRPLNFFSLVEGKFTDSSLPKGAKRYFGSWGAALRASGIDPTEVREQLFRKHRRYPDKPSVIDAIRKRKREGWPLNGGALEKGMFPNVILYKHSVRYFGSWDAALRAAGIDPAKVREQLFRKHRRYPDKPSVIEAIRKRPRDNRPLNFFSLVQGKFTDVALHDGAKRYFGSWDNALKGAGFDPAKTRLRRP